MKQPPFSVVVPLLLGVLTMMRPLPSSAGPAAASPVSRPLDGTEIYEQLLDESGLLLIARVNSVDSVATAISQPPAALSGSVDSTIVRARRCMLEPVDWLRGGLDGEEIEVFALEGEVPAALVRLASIARQDTSAGLIQLYRRGNEWFVDDYLRILSQRDFRTVRDSIHEARERIGVDSLVAHADLIIVTGDSLEIANRSGVERGTVRIVRRLKGEEPASAVRIQPYMEFSSVPRSVLFLRRVGSSVYEPMPFPNSSPPEFNDWDSDNWERQPFATETAVRSALERRAKLLGK